MPIINAFPESGGGMKLEGITSLPLDATQTSLISSVNPTGMYNSSSLTISYNSSTEEYSFSLNSGTMSGSSTGTMYYCRRETPKLIANKDYSVNGQIMQKGTIFYVTAYASYYKRNSSAAASYSRLCNIYTYDGETATIFLNTSGSSSSAVSATYTFTPV